MKLPKINVKLPARVQSKLAALKKRSKKNQKYAQQVKSVSDIFREFSVEMKKDRFAVLGIGNDLKGDDGAGWYVVDKLMKKLGKDKNFLFIKTSVPENHVREITEFSPSLLIIIDAADFRKSPGAIKYIQQYQISEAFVSTHTTPLTIFLRLYQADQEIKKNVMLIGIQKKNNDFGQPISAAVKKAGDRLSELINDLYRKGVLGQSLEKELEYTSNPFKKVADYFKKKESS